MGWFDWFKRESLPVFEHSMLILPCRFPVIYVDGLMARPYRSIQQFAQHHRCRRRDIREGKLIGHMIYDSGHRVYKVTGATLLARCAQPGPFGFSYLADYTFDGGTAFTLDELKMQIVLLVNAHEDDLWLQKIHRAKELTRQIDVCGSFEELVAFLNNCI